CPYNTIHLLCYLPHSAGLLHLWYCCLIFFNLFFSFFFLLFFFNDTATTEIYTLSLHDALPIYAGMCAADPSVQCGQRIQDAPARSEEHTSELQSQSNLVGRLLLEKKKKKKKTIKNTQK